MATPTRAHGTPTAGPNSRRPAPTRTDQFDVSNFQLWHDQKRNGVAGRIDGSMAAVGATQSVRPDLRGISDINQRQPLLGLTSGDVVCPWRRRSSCPVGPAEAHWAPM
jgi:hypothetical protein